MYVRFYIHSLSFSLFLYLHTHSQRDALLYHHIIGSRIQHLIADEKIELSKIFEIFSTMVVNFSQESQETTNAAVLSDKGVITAPCESYINLLSLSSPSSVKIPFSMDALSSFQNNDNLKNDSADVYSTYILNIDIEKGKPEALQSTEEMGGNVITEDSLAIMLQKEITSQMGGKLIQFLMNHNFELPKFTIKAGLMRGKTTQ
ncbi:PREDICTED: uncharacterized protein LOC109237350 isoform X2 [Nicotiana attenuata]|uniref:uncharacterized protein LOC109237350 isoform X2 n=1 Tax=Nicotiana attenuata TaxID=49451 RepID=UPI000905772F|nr:PREDICTED: uncharacterized protein LOC109237350 isoform X2 [Nicotiana attenuata]XP_019259193.1 PREDICTED: uncharacterized protein LOC109237350 isoform X2 [Nicotiana attenuata]XP_019259194.1 PREDICTED: uncharacterized protein LOC109237350 isoform X2 [Nicotiana attenuata]